MHKTEEIHNDLGNTILAIRRKRSQIKANDIKLFKKPNEINRAMIEGNNGILNRQIAALKLECEIFIKDLNTQIDLL